jgi:recombination protein RecT
MTTESAPSTAIAKSSPAHPVVRLRAQLDEKAPEFKLALPAHIPVDHFKRSILTACALNHDLYTVDRTSLLLACLKAAHDGLLPDQRDGVILPYKDNSQRSPTRGQWIAQWQPMIGGLLKRFRNSGQFLSVTANVVRESDPFEYWIDENGEHLRHTPGDVGPFIKAYAIAKTKDGGTFIKVMSKAEIDRRRAVSRAKDGPMWREWWDEAAMKTVLRNLSKRLPSSADLDELVRRDDEEDAFEARPAMPGASPVTGDTENEPRQVSDSAAVEITELERQRDDDPTPPADEGWRDEVGSVQEAADDVQEGGSPAAEADNSAVETAFAEGAEARRAGQARRAVPGPYREPQASHLAKAWFAGWDSAEQGAERHVRT